MSCSDLFKEISRRMSVSIAGPPSVGKEEAIMVEQNLSTWNDIFGNEVHSVFNEY
jgi:hypothetical protein